MAGAIDHASLIVRSGRDRWTAERILSEPAEAALLHIEQTSFT
jgi:hypothetical protein